MTRLPMRKIKEVLRLAARGMSTREMASSLQVGRTTLREYIYRARSAGLSWPLPNDLSDSDLERALFPRSVGDVRGSYAQPDWAHIHAVWPPETRSESLSAHSAVAAGHPSRIALQPLSDSLLGSQGAKTSLVV